jgi:hypothetical protein
MYYIILKPWYANGGGTLSTVYFEKKLYAMCMMTGKGFVAFGSIQSCVRSVVA